MTLTNHVPDPSSPETTLSVSPPSVEWMPLDGLIQSWAAFAHQTTSAAGLFAASSAFAALAHESSARSSSLEAEQVRVRDLPSWSPRIQATLTLALADLSEACQRWIEAEQWLSCCIQTQEEDAVLLAPLLQARGTHETVLFRLFLRVLDKAGTESGHPLRVLVGQLRVSEREGES